MTKLLDAFQVFKSARLVNLTHKIDENSPHFPALPSLEKKDIFTLKDGFHVQQFTVVGQYGTHIDAPIHFVEGGKWLDQIALEDLLLPLYVIDKSQAVAENPNYELTKQDILDFEAEYGQIESGAQQTPGWSREALEFLIHERGVKAVGHETLDTDSGKSAFENGGALKQEYYLLEQGIYQVEVLANLDQLPATGSVISIAYPNWKEATGSPVRAVAYVNK
ncbi:cyclase family protein [Streptococcus hillyeri]|uniref:Cyclase family protein n=1 Tax=Streptococcus hillyeri TaxID=2282420 RepID=A0A3L9DZ07_9STRE|nr:cyclase family protein [Streptococcus hillyeri]RLY04352.1 cyclase family protein [Streptococcus hillyeri]